MVAFAESKLDVQQFVQSSVGPHSCSLVFEPWPEQLPFRFDLGVSVQTDVLRFQNHLADFSAHCDLVVSSELCSLRKLHFTRLMLVGVPVAAIVRRRLMLLTSRVVMHYHVVGLRFEILFMSSLPMLRADRYLDLVKSGISLRWFNCSL